MRLVADALEQVREILKDDAGARYSTASLLRLFNDGIVEARALRPDLFVGSYDLELAQINLVAAQGNAFECDRKAADADTFALLYTPGSFDFSQYPGAIVPGGIVSMTLTEGETVFVDGKAEFNGVYIAAQTLMDGLVLVRHPDYRTMLALSAAVVEYNDQYYKCTNNTFDSLYNDPVIWAEVYADRIPLPDQLYASLVYYVAGRAELRDDEFAVDGRAMTLASMLGKKLIQGG